MTNQHSRGFICPFYWLLLLLSVEGAGDWIKPKYLTISLLLLLSYSPCSTLINGIPFFSSADHEILKRYSQRDRPTLNANIKEWKRCDLFTSQQRWLSLNGRGGVRRRVWMDERTELSDDLERGSSGTLIHNSSETRVDTVNLASLSCSSQSGSPLAASIPVLAAIYHRRRVIPEDEGDHLYANDDHLSNKSAIVKSHWCTRDSMACPVDLHTFFVSFFLAE